MNRTRYLATWALLKLAGVEGLFGPAGLTLPGPPFGRYPSSANSSSWTISSRRIAPTTKNGWGGRIRTSVWRDQNPLPYRLATPQLVINDQRLAKADSQPVANLATTGNSSIPLLDSR